MAARSASEICDQIEEQVNQGHLLPGHQLASVRELAASLGVSPTTVAAAYRKLRERGMVVGRGRQGSRVAPRVAVASLGSPAVPTGLVDAATGTPDPAMLPPLAAALASAGQAPQARYGDPMILDSLASAGQKLFAADGVAASHLTITSGAMDAIERVLAAQGFRAGDRIGVEDPGHIPLHQLCRAAGLQLVPLPVDPNGITPDGLAAALQLGLAGLVVTPRAQNPTGAALTEERAAQLSEVLRPHPSVCLIIDDHAGPVAGTQYQTITPPGQRWATVRSLGKSMGPDLRLALVAADQKTIARVTVAVSNGPGWVSHILQRTAAHLLTNKKTERLVEEAARSYQQRRDALIQALSARGIAATGRSGLNVWIPTSNEQAAVESARNAGIAIRAAGPYRIVSAPAVRATITNLSNTNIQELADALASVDTNHAAAM